jgi:hypothetical protein
VPAKELADLAPEKVAEYWQRAQAVAAMDAEETVVARKPNVRFQYFKGEGNANKLDGIRRKVKKLVTQSMQRSPDLDPRQAVTSVLVGSDVEPKVMMALAAVDGEVVYAGTLLVIDFTYTYWLCYELTRVLFTDPYLTLPTVLHVRHCCSCSGR